MYLNGAWESGCAFNYVDEVYYKHILEISDECAKPRLIETFNS